MCPGTLASTHAFVSPRSQLRPPAPCRIHLHLASSRRAAPAGASTNPHALGLVEEMRMRSSKIGGSATQHEFGWPLAIPLYGSQAWQPTSPMLYRANVRRKATADRDADRDKVKRDSAGTQGDSEGIAAQIEPTRGGNLKHRWFNLKPSCRLAVEPRPGIAAIITRAPAGPGDPAEAPRLKL